MPRLSLMMLAPLALLAACGSVPTRNFEIRAEDFDGKEVKCLVVVDHRYPRDGQTFLYTPCAVPVEFTKTRMNVKAHPVQFDDDGEPIPPTDGQSPAQWNPDSYDLEIDDPAMIRFILRRNTDYRPGG